MRTLIIIVCALAMSACTTTQREATWQSLHAVDIAQTLSQADDPCYIESHPVTRALIGERPSQTDVLLWGVGMAAGHALITHALSDAPGWVQGAWQGTTILLTGATIVGNHEEGIRVSGNNKPVQGCNL